MDGSDEFGLVFDPDVLQHDTGLVQEALPDGTPLMGADHPSNSDITSRTHALLTASGFAARCTPLATRYATVDELAAFHTRDYIALVEHLSHEGGGEAGEAAPVSAGTYLAARIAAGGSLAAVEAVLEGNVRAAYVLARPPGHHALADAGMGYCIFNNVVVAALHGRGLGAGRTMILDWDVHHGNGTQSAFYFDPDVLFLSLHQDNWYPRDMGLLDQRGEDDGFGSTINVPLPPGAGDLAYTEVFERIVAPAARRFRPDLLLVSAGQDASMFDPLGRMLVTMNGFQALGSLTRALADELCGGRLVVLQEGGYSATYTPHCTLAALCGLAGMPLEVPDPYAATSELWRAQTIHTPDAQRAIEYAVAMHRESLAPR